jgi:hypothetical protein
MSSAIPYIVPFFQFFQKMPNHFLLRVGDGVHFAASSSKSIWGVTSKYVFTKGFLDKVREGDLLWFVLGKSKGKIIAVATFTRTRARILGVTASNEELGWDKTDGKWDTEVHYKDLYNLTSQHH